MWCNLQIPLKFQNSTPFLFAKLPKYNVKNSLAFRVIKLSYHEVLFKGSYFNLVQFFNIQEMTYLFRLIRLYCL